MYSRRPTSMPTWASADRTVQRGCEPRAIDPLQGEKRERGRFLAPAILAQNEIFSISPNQPTTSAVPYFPAHEIFGCYSVVSGPKFVDRAEKFH
jgi:hypothetical protein